MTLIHEGETGQQDFAARESAARAEAEASRDEIDDAVARLDETAAASRADLAANADARARLRRQAEKTELRLAFRNLAEGVRGMIRVAPFTALLVGVASGVALGARRRPRRPPPRG